VHVRHTRFHARFGTWLVVMLALACASTPDTDPSEERSVLAGSAVQNVLILPINVTTTTPPDLEPHLPRVWEGLEDYLGLHGMRLRTVNYQVTRQFWLGSIKKVRERPGGKDAGFDAAMKELIRKLAFHAEFDTVLVPTVFIAQAPIEEKSAHWDGVEREVSVVANSLAGKAVAETVPLEGLAPAATLHMAVYDGEGNKIQEGRGGIDLLIEVRVKHNPYGPGDDPVFRFMPRSDPFADPEHVREGIAIALSPFLPALLPPHEEEAETPGN